MVGPLTSSFADWPNDDLLITSEGRANFALHHPRAVPIFDWSDLRQLFTTHDPAAAALRRRSRQQGLIAVLLGFLSLAVAAFNSLAKDIPAASYWIGLAAALLAVASGIIGYTGVLSGRTNLAASTFMGLNVFAASVWTPTFLERVHGLSMGSVASIIGPIRGIFGIAGVLIGGFTIDRLMRRSPHWRVTLPALACMLLAPVEVLFLLASEQWLWMAAFAGSAFLTLIHQGPLFALVMEVVPSRMRAIAIATLVLFSGLLGQAAGPLIVGMTNDALAPTMGDTAIRYSMLIIGVTAVLAGLMIMLSRKHLEQPNQPPAEPRK